MSCADASDARRRANRFERGRIRGRIRTTEFGDGRLLPPEAYADQRTEFVAVRQLTIRHVGGYWAYESSLQCDGTSRKHLPSWSDSAHPQSVLRWAQSAETGQRARHDLLLTNDLTGQRKLSRVRRSCPETGKRGRERDLVRCEITDVLVAAEATTVCTETNTRALLELMVRCDECGASLLERRATRTVRGEAAHEVHTADCSWTGETHLHDGLGHWAKTHVRVRSDLLEGSGVARVLVELRRRADSKEIGDADLHDVVQAALAQGIKVRRVWCQSNPTRRSSLSSLSGGAASSAWVRRTWRASSIVDQAGSTGSSGSGSRSGVFLMPSRSAPVDRVADRPTARVAVV